MALSYPPPSPTLFPAVPFVVIIDWIRSQLAEQVVTVIYLAPPYAASLLDKLRELSNLRRRLFLAIITSAVSTDS